MTFVINPMIPSKYDYIVIGAGIMGLSIGRTIKERDPYGDILIIEKEEEEAMHASGRNSGVLHAGFYYTADSLKAKLTVLGNRAMKEYCVEKNLPVNSCGKLVVAQNEQEVAALYELEKRGRRNGSRVRLIDEREALELEPNVRTLRKALYSPDTATVDPKAICRSLRVDLLKDGVKILFGAKYLNKRGRIVETTAGEFECKHHLINCAGLYADTIARDFGYSRDYTVIPFKGLYLKYTKNRVDVRMHIYPVPDLRSPFLGVHFTKTVEGDIKIGPTAIPALWRENYAFNFGFDAEEVCAILWEETRLLIKNSFGFRQLAVEEIKKYNKKYFIKLAQKMVQYIDPTGFTEYTKPGIRAQLLDRRSRSLVEDFIIEGDINSTHILNAVSPAFTCAFPFAQYVAEHYIPNRLEIG